jgi:hypothetical protein
MITSIDLVSAHVLIVLYIYCLVVCLEQNTVRERGALLLLVDVDTIRDRVSFVGGHEVNWFFVVAREPIEQVTLLVQLIVFLHIVLSVVNKLDEVRVLALESHIQVPHYKVVVRTRIRLKFVLRLLHIDAL